MRKPSVISVVLPLVILLGFLLCKVATHLPTDIDKVLNSTPAQTATLTSAYTLDGQVMQSLGDIDTTEAAIVITIVWDVGCPYCRQELQYLQHTYVNQPSIMVVGMNPYDTDKQIREYVDVNGLTSIVVVVGNLMDWLPPGVPFTSVYTSDGDLLEQFFGWSKENGPNQLTEIIEKGLQ